MVCSSQRYVLDNLECFFTYSINYLVCKRNLYTRLGRELLAPLVWAFIYPGYLTQVDTLHRAETEIQVFSFQSSIFLYANTKVLSFFSKRISIQLSKAFWQVYSLWTKRIALTWRAQAKLLLGSASQENASDLQLHVHSRKYNGQKEDLFPSRKIIRCLCLRNRFLFRILRGIIA